MATMENTMFLVFVFVALITKEALAAQHAVGGSQGWDESTDFDTWAKGQTFKVGDQLVFKYASGLHSVVEVASESAYKNCDLGSALNSMNGGSNVVKLNKAGTRYFACGTLGHCNQGMKVKIKTVTGNAPSSPAPSSTSDAPGPSQSSASFVMAVAVLLATFMLYVF
ncbi:mavicyanin [Alnus glutinosa]|uniref:mavicyanin n=1 Tax=Alnus glutinosa TaxID=3517 RepID=UPI002D7930EF|nr:mavicyanin [Alnus glutinosa]